MSLPSDSIASLRVRGRRREIIVTHTHLTRHTRNGATPGWLAARGRAGLTRRPSAVGAVVAACAALALFLRAYQLTRPGYLFGVTEYDDGVLFGNALRLVTGVIPYRDFSMVQPPGGMLLMVPAALLGKVARTAWGLAAARLLTVGADTANVILLGVLVRRRGPLAAGIACGVYAVYPDAIIAAHTFSAAAYLPAVRPLGRRRPEGANARALDGHTLDAYAVACAVAVTAMLLWPRLYYPHYGAFDGPFLSLALALPAGLLATRRRPARRPALQATVAAVTALLIVGVGCWQFRAEARLRGVQVAALADRLIPAGACVVSNGAAYTVAADRFYSDVPGCPALVDPLGTMIAMTTGRFRDATAAELWPEIDLWQSALERAQYVWLTSDTYQMIPWNHPLDGYFTRHFRLIGFAGHPTGYRYVPPVGLYART
jgi:hypothetical protein